MGFLRQVGNGIKSMADECPGFLTAEDEKDMLHRASGYRQYPRPCDFYDLQGMIL